MFKFAPVKGNGIETAQLLAEKRYVYSTWFEHNVSLINICKVQTKHCVVISVKIEIKENMNENNEPSLTKVNENKPRYAYV